jgi:proton-dependent oligopeptide transporter, POT family
MENIASISGARKIPDFLKILFFVEMWERFSYYGMRALLILFLTSQLHLADQESYTIYALFAAIGYALPVLGGFLADKLMGYRNMVLIGGITITCGHIFLGLMKFYPDFIYLGLAMVAVGTGMFKGNITNLLGTCYEKNDPERSRGFTLFYVGVNLGSFLSSILCGYLAHLYGWEYGFGLAGIGMAIGLCVFIKFQHILGDAGLANKSVAGKKILGFNFFPIILISSILLAVLVSKMLMASEYFANLLAYSGVIMLMLFFYIIAKSDKTEQRGLVVLSILIAFLMCFFALEMQLGSLINLFSQRNIDNEILGVTVPASLSQAINPMSIIILGSIFGRYMKFSKKYVTRKFLLGIFTMVLCFLVLYIGCLDANSDGKVSYVYLILSISLMGLGELCVAPLVQEQATLLAPKNLRGMVMGIVLLSLAFSNLAGIIISKFMSIPSVNGEIDSLVSLEIYKAGFLKICLFNVALTIIFLLFYRFVNRTISK